MGLYDRDYMREPRPPAPPGGRIGLFIFIAIVLTLVIAYVRAHPKLKKKYVTRPFERVMDGLEKRR